MSGLTGWSGLPSILSFHAFVSGHDNVRDLVGDGVCAESTRLARGRLEQPGQPSSPVAARTRLGSRVLRGRWGRGGTFRCRCDGPGEGRVTPRPQSCQEARDTLSPGERGLGQKQEVAVS